MKPARLTVLAAAAAVLALAGTLPATSAPLDRHGRLADFVDAHLERMSERLELTEAQESEIRTILEEQHAACDRQKAEARTRIDAVLTDAQRAERDRFMDARLDRHVDRLADRLDLTADQASQVRAILAGRRTNPELGRDEIRERIAAVLTDEQRQDFERMEDRRGHGGPGGRPGPWGGPGPDFDGPEPPL